MVVSLVLLTQDSVAVEEGIVMSIDAKIRQISVGCVWIDCKL